MGNTGHTLCHSGLYKLVVECSVCILKAPVAVKQRTGIRVCFYSLIQRLKDDRIVIVLTQYIGHNTPVTEIKDGAQVELMYLNALILFELRHIGKPFLIGFLRMELAVQQVFSKILRGFCLLGASTIIVLYSGSDIPDTADAQHSLIVDIDTVVMTQIVIQSPIAFIRAFRMDFLNLVGQMFILRNSAAQFPESQFIVS